MEEREVRIRLDLVLVYMFEFFVQTDDCFFVLTNETLCCFDLACQSFDTILCLDERKE